MVRSREPLTPYSCVRCGYHTQYKNDIRRHFSKKKHCPSLLVDIELTEDIKSHILENRTYHVPEPVSLPTHTQIINNYNTMNNFVSSIDPLKKIKDYMKHKNIPLIPFDRSVEMKFEKTRQKLERGHGIHSMSQDDIFEILDNVTRAENESLDDFNYYYDSDMKKLLMYESGDWKELYVSSGLKMIIRTIQDYLWNAYECYLIKKIISTDSAFDKQKLKELITEYYTFLGCLDVEPFVKGRYNNMILHKPDDDEYWVDPSPRDIDAWSISEEYMRIYSNIPITPRQKDKLKSDLLDIVKRNSKKNVCELNKVVMSLINMDAEFKRDMMSFSVI